MDPVNNTSISNDWLKFGSSEWQDLLKKDIKADLTLVNKELLVQPANDYLSGTSILHGQTASNPQVSHVLATDPIYVVVPKLAFQLQTVVNNTFKNYASATDYVSNSYTAITELLERNNQMFIPGTEEYVRKLIGSDLFKKLSIIDREFLIKASATFDLGQNVDIQRVLSYLKED